MSNKGKKILIIVTLAVTLVIIGGSILLYNYLSSDTYALKKKGYTKEEIKEIMELDKNKYAIVLEHDKDFNMLLFFKEKYYIDENLDKYLNYKNKSDHTIEETITIINLGLDNEFYNNPAAADTSKGDLILVNKYYYLEDSYVPEKLKTINLQYAFSNKSLAGEAYNAFISMASNAKNSGIILLANTSYRSYNAQASIYDNNVLAHDRAYADKYVARSGYSEHQTGLAVDIATYNSEISSYTINDFENTEAFNWLTNNAYRYGFILRYPKDKEYITGFNYEPWHYRYVGIEAATIINESDLTFDEYYFYNVK